MGTSAYWEGLKSLSRMSICDARYGAWPKQHAHFLVPFDMSLELCSPAACVRQAWPCQAQGTSPLHMTLFCACVYRLSQSIEWHLCSMPCSIPWSLEYNWLLAALNKPNLTSFKHAGYLGQCMRAVKGIVAPSFELQSWTLMASR